MQKTESKKPAPKTKIVAAPAATATATTTATTTETTTARPRSVTKVTTRSFSEAPAATKFATAAAVEPPPVYMELRTREDEHAEAIKKLEGEIEGLKAIAVKMQQAMDQKLKMYVKLQFGAMSLLGMFNIFG